MATEEDKRLYSISELRPLAWSKTITVFDVYETDEEGFIPYISPLATVGTINTGTTTNQTSTSDETIRTEEENTE